MISRQWIGIAKPAEARSYVEHLHRDTFPKLASIGGFISASILRRSLPIGEEFLIVTLWESMEAIKSFAGDRPEIAVVPAVVQAMMVEYEKIVRHYSVTDTYSPRQGRS
jgi:heme-degrading monooxygenase HmoA